MGFVPKKLSAFCVELRLRYLLEGTTVCLLRSEWRCGIFGVWNISIVRISEAILLDMVVSWKEWHTVPVKLSTASIV